MNPNETKAIFGRDAVTSQLKVTCGSVVKRFGAQGCVPNTVSREHCSITMNPDGSYRLINLKPQNVTYVNGMEVNAKIINENDCIELGPGKMQLSWNVIKTMMPSVADIRPLRFVWENHQNEMLKYQTSERRFNALRSATGVLTLLGVILGFAIPNIRESSMFPIYALLYVIAIGASLGFTIKAYLDASKMPQQMKEMNERFMQSYSCPKCHHFLGNLPYNILCQNDACPYCKAKFQK